jgi:serine/threonine-protein kinase RsbW
MDTVSTIRITAEVENLAVIRRFVEEAAMALEADPGAVPDVVLAVNEIATNVIVHGYRGQPGIIEVEVGRMGDSLIVRVRDQAPAFDPLDVPPPDLTLPLEMRPFGGMGVYLAKQLVDEMTHLVTPQGGNELTLVKKKSIPKEESNDHYH